MSSEEIDFPDVFADVLSSEEVSTYFEDLRRGAIIHELRVKDGARSYASQGQHDLVRCSQDWAEGALYSLQIMYTFEGQVWCDTLQRTETGTRVVRLKSDR